ncbi:MAG: hypothetical protein ABJB74_13320 [Gemmatimonas sp.]
MSHNRFWRIAYWLLLLSWLSAGALGMMGVHAGFVTSYLADLTQPAWLYVFVRTLAPGKRAPGWLARTVGATPERAALVLFVGSTLTEISQRFWPQGVFEVGGIHSTYSHTALVLGSVTLRNAVWVLRTKTLSPD